MDNYPLNDTDYPLIDTDYPLIEQDWRHWRHTYFVIGDTLATLFRHWRHIGDALATLFVIGDTFSIIGDTFFSSPQIWCRDLARDLVQHDRG